MTDKYEEFKEWFKKKSHRYGVWKIDDNDNQEICHYSRAFIDFEEEQSEKEKEKEIKDTIEQALHEEHCCFDGTRLYTNAIYNKLKEKDLIK